MNKLRAQLQSEHQQIAGEVRSLTSDMEAECQKRVREEQQRTADAEAAVSTEQSEEPEGSVRRGSERGSRGRRTLRRR